MLLLISYDLKKPDQDYVELIKAIKNQGESWWHHLESTWLIQTELSPGQVRDNLTVHIDSNDKILVIQVTRNWAAKGFLQRAYDWLKNRDF